MMNTTTNNNNSNNNFQLNTFDSQFKITTQNIQGLNNNTKQHQILTYMSDNNIDILSLSETHLNKQKSKIIYKHTPDYKAYFNNDSTDSFAGVGFLVSNNYTKYIHRIKGYKGRVIFMDLFLKGRYKLRIIQIYIPPRFSAADK